ncbi:MAG: hypothetical protein J6A06_03865 [Fibrobacteraceae bacterium]|jgi:hypothetical protein|nr:hypothetical protein [Fibrobacteraceae bacterium]MEE1068504.1 hypothetical protein [Fibrobacteraceae bacterium]
MKLGKLLLISLGVLTFAGCASRYSSPVLIERGEGRKDYEREYFAIKESMGIDRRLKEVFMQGYIEEGMTNDMVNLLWGPPDRESDDGFVWEYYTREGKLITRLLWKNPETARLKGYENEMVLEKIEGDRYGGSPPPQSKSTSNY